jgi:hypothetical protein
MLIPLDRLVQPGAIAGGRGSESVHRAWYGELGHGILIRLHVVRHRRRRERARWLGERSLQGRYRPRGAGAVARRRAVWRCMADSAPIHRCPSPVQPVFSRSGPAGLNGGGCPLSLRIIVGEAAGCEDYGAQLGDAAATGIVEVHKRKAGPGHRILQQRDRQRRR